MTPAEEFAVLDPPERRRVHFALCRQALDTWNAFCASAGELSYVESVCGTKQVVDPGLPGDALAAALSGEPDPALSRRYLEPIAALQDGDLELREEIEYAYYALYNLYRRYSEDRSIDDWLIVNQALASRGPVPDGAELLVDAMRGARRS